MAVARVLLGVVGVVLLMVGLVMAVDTFAVGKIGGGTPGTTYIAGYVTDSGSGSMITTATVELYRDVPGAPAARVNVTTTGATIGAAANYYQIVVDQDGYYTVRVMAQGWVTEEASRWVDVITLRNWDVDFALEPPTQPSIPPGPPGPVGDETQGPGQVTYDERVQLWPAPTAAALIVIGFVLIVVAWTAKGA